MLSLISKYVDRKASKIVLLGTDYFKGDNVNYYFTGSYEGGIEYLGVNGYNKSLNIDNDIIELQFFDCGIGERNRHCVLPYIKIATCCIILLSFDKDKDFKTNAKKLADLFRDNCNDSYKNNIILFSIDVNYNKYYIRYEECLSISKEIQALAYYESSRITFNELF